MLDALFHNGRIIWLILAAVAVEAAALTLWLRQQQRTAVVPGLLANLAAGACLMAAIGALLAGWGLSTLAALLALSLVAHGLDLWLRLKL
jgi:hypothetical protein